MAVGEAIIIARTAAPLRIEVDGAVFVKPTFFGDAGQRAFYLESLSMAIERVAMIAAAELGKAKPDKLIAFIEGGAALLDGPFGK